MKPFTRYMSKQDKTEVEAVYWDGSYDIYAYLLREEPYFVGVLDDAGQKGKDKMKIWNEASKTWEVCEKGHYVIKNKNHTFTVKSRDEVVTELSPLR